MSFPVPTSGINVVNDTEAMFDGLISVIDVSTGNSFELGISFPGKTINFPLTDHLSPGTFFNIAVQALGEDGGSFIDNLDRFVLQSNVTTALIVLGGTLDTPGLTYTPGTSAPTS